MRNLKKILALVLALVMSLSLMATAGASSFPDVDDSNPYATAIEVLDELKVFQGFDDGTFKPTDTLNRAQAAVLVYRIATGDVENKYLDNYTFMQQSKFTDLDGYNWAKGYINYCQNAGIVVGTTATTFDPGAKVTGYQLLVMLLRTLGYGKAGEFADPKGWELQTAAIAEREGITDGVTSGDFGAPAQRQMVAEILFRGLLTETVTYSQLTSGGYTKSGVTLGKRELGLEEIEGVVTGNEFADLNSDQVLAEGKTQIQVEGEDNVRTLNYGTKLTDIGESRLIYTQNTSKVLSIADSGKNKVTEYGHASVVDTASKFQAAAEMAQNSDTEFYINFGRADKNTCDQRLEFSVVFYGLAAENSFDSYRNINISKIAADESGWSVEIFTSDGRGNETWLPVVLGSNTDYEYTTVHQMPGETPDTATGSFVYRDHDYPVRYTKVIWAGQSISDADLTILESIFGTADNANNNVLPGNRITGDVYVGTKSTPTETDEERDLSNQISYKKFYEDYINTELYDRNWTRSDNGEWVKFVDNDGDGACEYAFLTRSNLDEVISTYTKADETLVTEFYSFDDNAYTVRYLDETPTVGDVVLYSYIDGQILVEDAENVTKKVTDYSWKDDQITTSEGDTYGQSGIENWTEMQQLISTMADDTEYVMYFDHFGYIRAYELPGGTQYALVTEIYANNVTNGNLVQNWPMTVELTMPNEDGKAETREYSLANPTSRTYRNELTSEYAWTEVGSYRGTYSYFNYLQPAISHLGVTRNDIGGLGYLGADRKAPTFGTTQYTYWQQFDRQIVKEITNLNSSTEFNYGAQVYDRINANGTITADVEVPAPTTSFTNIAVVNINGDSAAVNGAAQLRLNQDGSIQRRGGNARYAVDYIQLATGAVTAKAARYAIDGTSTYISSNNYYVNATNNTEYYIVDDGGVYYFKGFSNMPALKAEDIHAAYAVARDTSADDSNNPYWVADVIVYEVKDLDDYQKGSISLVYYNPNRNWERVQALNTLNSAYGPLMNLVPEQYGWNAENGIFGSFAGWGFYRLGNETKLSDEEMSARTITQITGDFNKEGIFAGTVVRVARVAVEGDYIDINTSGLDVTGAVWDGTNQLRTDVSLLVTKGVYSVTNVVTNPGTQNEITTTVATKLRVLETETRVNESGVKPNDHVIWVGTGSTGTPVNTASFVVDMGNDGSESTPAIPRSQWNSGIRNDTPEWLQSYTTVNGVTTIDAPAAGSSVGLWQNIMNEQAINPADFESVNFNVRLGDGEKATFTVGEQSVTLVGSNDALGVPELKTASITVPKKVDYSFTLTIKLTPDTAALAAFAVGTGWSAQTPAKIAIDAGKSVTYQTVVGKGALAPLALNDAKTVYLFTVQAVEDMIAAAIDPETDPDVADELVAILGDVEDNLYDAAGVNSDLADDLADVADKVEENKDAAAAAALAKAQDAAKDAAKALVTDAGLKDPTTIDNSSDSEALKAVKTKYDALVAAIEACTAISGAEDAAEDVETYYKNGAIVIGADGAAKELKDAIDAAVEAAAGDAALTAAVKAAKEAADALVPAAVADDEGVIAKLSALKEAIDTAAETSLDAVKAIYNPDAVGNKWAGEAYNALIGAIEAAQAKVKTTISITGDGVTITAGATNGVATLATASTSDHTVTFSIAPTVTWTPDDVSNPTKYTATFTFTLSNGCTAATGGATGVTVNEGIYTVTVEAEGESAPEAAETIDVTLKGPDAT